MKCEIRCCLPFPFNWTIMETADFPALSLDISNRGFTRAKKLPAGAGGHSVMLVV